MNAHQINELLQEEKYAGFVQFLNELFLQHIEYEMFKAEGLYHHHEMNFERFCSVDEAVDWMNQFLKYDTDYDDTLDYFEKRICENLSTYQPYIDILNCVDEIYDVYPFIDFTAAREKFETLRDEMFI